MIIISALFAMTYDTFSFCLTGLFSEVCVRLGGITVRVSYLRASCHGFDSRSGRYQAT